MFKDMLASEKSVAQSHIHELKVKCDSDVA